MKRNRDRQVADVIIKARQHKFLSQWVERFNEQHEWRKITLSPYFAAPAPLTPRKAIFNYKLYQKPYRAFYYRLKNSHLMYTKERFFGAWLKFLINAKITKKKIEHIQDKATKMRNHFTVWRNLFHQKYELREKLENMAFVLKRFSAQIFFGSLIKVVTAQIETEIADDRALVNYSKNLKYKAFFGWILRARELSEKRQNNDVAMSTYAGNLMRKGLLTMNEYMRYRADKKRGMRQALIIYAYQIMRGHFYYWKKYTVQKAILNARTLEFQRNQMENIAPAFFSQLKLNFYLESFKKISVPKADK